MIEVTERPETETVETVKEVSNTSCECTAALNGDGKVIICIPVAKGEFEIDKDKDNRVLLVLTIPEKMGHEMINSIARVLSPV